MSKIDEWYKKNEEVVLEAVSRIKWGGVTEQGWVRAGKPFNKLPFSLQLKVRARADEFIEIMKLISELNQKEE